MRTIPTLVLTGLILAAPVSHASRPRADAPHAAPASIVDPPGMSDAERFHAYVTDSCGDLIPRAWYDAPRLNHARAERALAACFARYQRAFTL